MNFNVVYNLIVLALVIATVLGDPSQTSEVVTSIVTEHANPGGGPMQQCPTPSGNPLFNPGNPLYSVAAIVTVGVTWLISAIAGYALPATGHGLGIWCFTQISTIFGAVFAGIITLGTATRGWVFGCIWSGSALGTAILAYLLPNFGNIFSNALFWLLMFLGIWPPFLYWGH